MKRLLLTVFLILTFAATTVYADEWESLVNEALKQKLSKSKRRTRSGRRILREKVERLHAIDAQVPVLIQQRDYGRAESLLKESLSLTIELYDKIDDIHVVERFVRLGILYTHAGNREKAQEVYRWALSLGEPILGKGSYQLSNVYRSLAVMYYDQGKYSRAEENANLYMSGMIGHFGVNSPQAEDAKRLLKKVYKRGR